MAMVPEGRKGCRPELGTRTTATFCVLQLLLLVSTADGGGGASCLSSEASILLRIKQDLRLSNGRLSSWVADGSDDCCMWEGVDCDPHTGHIIGLQLRATTTVESFHHYAMDSLWMTLARPFGLKCEGAIDPRDITGSSIPPALFELYHLQRLDLSGCDFNGSAIPLELTQLTHLTHLNLSRAWFSGRVPNELSSLFDLVSLDLSYISCFYFDVPPFTFNDSVKLELRDLEGFVKNFKNLEYLNLDYVGIALSNSQEWSINLASSLPNLRSLSLAFCDLEGSVSPHLFKLPHIQALDLSNSFHLKGKLMPSLFPPESNLQSLRLSRTGLFGRLPPELFELPLLKVLDLSFSDVSGPLPCRLPKSKLQILKLAGIMLSGSLPNWIGNLTSLVELDLTQTGLSGSLPITIGDLRCLRSLGLSDTSLSGSLPITIGNLTALTLLDLSRTGLSGKLPLTMANLTALAYLNLGRTNVQGDLPTVIRNLKALSHLDLQRGMFTSILDSSLFVNLTQLTYLDLSENKISGSLPALPPYLNFIYLSSNNLSGPIPNSYNLFKIKELDLSSNSLTGSITSSLIHGPSSMQSPLEHLDLSNNKFGGHLDLGIFAVFKNLRSLSLSGNNLTVDVHNPNLKFPNLQDLKLVSCKVDQFPQFLRHHKPIQSLDLSKNMITGEIPKWLSISRTLNISYNKLTSIEQGFFSNLPWEVDLSFNMLNGLPSSLFPSASSFDRVDLVSISNNNLTGEIPTSLCNFTGVFLLDLSNNRLSGQIPACLFNLTLEGVMLQNNQLEGQIPEFDYHSRIWLSLLDLSDNRFVGYIPTSLGHCKKLNFINLGHNKLSGEFPSGLAKLPGLEGVKLQNNQLEGQIPEFDYHSLWILDLSDNRFVGYIPTSLRHCKGLEFINLGHNKLSGEFPSELARLPNLKVLVLKSNFLSGAINFNFDQNAFPKLIMLDISTNQFIGRLPLGLLLSLKDMKMFDPKSTFNGTTKGFYVIDWEVKMNNKGTELTYERHMLSIMKIIDLSNNYFEGEIPKEIGDLSGLQALNISNNKLKNQIPKSIGSLKHLESLDLSHNYLSGEIPEELAALNSLEYLNLSYNNLAGRIPQSPQFSTFEAPSFEGNPDLCGKPLSHSCPEANNGTTLVPFAGMWETDEETMWKYISVGLGFGVGFGIAISFSFFLNNWRYFNSIWKRCYWSYP